MKLMTSDDKKLDAGDTALFVLKEKDYGASYKRHLLAQYRLCVEMSDRISSRRTLANDFFLSLNTLMVALIGILVRLGSVSALFLLAWIVIASSAGILFCWVWYTTIKCYRQLNSAKFKVINQIEEKLPARAFQTEWSCLCTENNSQRYPELTKVEIYTPTIFAILYVALMIITVISTVISMIHIDP